MNLRKVNTWEVHFVINRTTHPRCLLHRRHLRLLPFPQCKQKMIVSVIYHHRGYRQIVVDIRISCPSVSIPDKSIEGLPVGVNLVKLHSEHLTTVFSEVLESCQQVSICDGRPQVDNEINHSCNLIYYMYEADVIPLSKMTGC